jgi:aminopeptidase N
VDKRREEMITDREQIIAYHKKQQAPVVDKTVTDLMKLLNANSYQKGGWVLHMLRQEIGTEVFWAGIREYYARFKNSNALSSDFQQAMEKVSGKDLSSFFSQWLYQPGHPQLDGEWKYDDQSKTVKITVNQVQKGFTFKFPLEIAVYLESESAPTLQKITVDKQSGEFSVPIAQKPVKIQLDPQVNLLFEGKLRN